jgi:CHAD domain-containing protein
MHPRPLSFQTASESEAQAAMRFAAGAFPGRLETASDTSGTYLDTFDWRLYRQGASLLSTRESGATVLRWTPFDGSDGLRLRLSSVPEFIWDLPPGPFRSSMEPVVEMRRLMPRLEIRSRGETLHILDGNQKTVARIHLEEASIPGTFSGSQEVALPIVLTAEPIRGYEKQFQEVIDLLQGELGLQPTSTDRLTTGLELLGLDPASWSHKLEVQLTAQMRSDEAAREIHKTLLKAIEDNEPGVRENLDSEFLHDFRVAVRRTRSALTQIRGVYPQAVVDHFKPEFAWLGRATGPTRDLDVHLLKMPEYRATLPEAVRAHLEPLQEFLIRHQHLEHQKLIDTLDSERYRRLLEGWQRFLDEPTPAGAEEHLAPSAAAAIAVTAADGISKAYHRVLERGQSITPESPPATLHRLRIDCKKLRYLLEFFRSLYAAEEIGIFIKALKRLQDHLGDFNDLGIQQARLRRFAHEMFQEGLATPETLMALGRLVDHLEIHQLAERKRLQKEFKKFAAGKNRARFQELLGKNGPVAT